MLLLFALLPAAGVSAAPPEKYTPSEKAGLAAARATGSLDGRVKIYDAAFERLEKEMLKSFRAGEFGPFPDTLANLSGLLEESLADIAADSRAGKSRRLIRYEIHLRQALKELQSRRARMPEELYDAFQDFLEQTGRTRRQLMDILFHQE